MPIFALTLAYAQSPDPPGLLDEAQASIDAEKYEDGAQLALRAIDLFRTRGDKRGTASAYIKLSDAYLPWRKLNAALDAARQAKALAAEEADNALRWRAQIAEGEALRDKGDLDAARAVLERSLDGFKALADRSGEARSLVALSAVFRLTGEQDRAMATARQALAVNREVNDSRIEARALYTIGNSALEVRKSGTKLTQQELAITLESLNAILTIPSLTNRLRVQTLQAIETAYCLNGQLEKCRALAREQLELAQRGGDHLAIAWAYFKMVLPLRLSGQKQEALEPALRAVASLREVDHAPNDEIYFLATLGERYFELEQYPKAAEYLQQAVDVVERLRDGLVPTEQSKAAWASDWRFFYTELIMTLFPFDRGRAFQVAELSRARGFLDTLAELEVDLRQSLPASEREREKAIAASINEAETLLHRPNVSESVRRHAAAGLEAAEAEMERFRLDVRHTNPRLAAIHYTRPLGIEETQRTLKPGTALIEYSVTAEHTYVWVVTCDRWTTALLPGRKPTEDLVNALRKALGAPVSSLGLRLAQSESASLAAKLYDTLLKPLEGDLAGVQSLIIVPDGVLYYVPFEVLESSGKYLLERFAISYAPSATSLAVTPEAPAIQAKSLLAYGDPVYSASQASAERGFDLGALPYTREEINGIAELFPSNNRSIHLGAGARVDAVNSEPLERFRYIHFATHGLLNEAHPGRSGLALTAGPANDGILRVDAITALRLRAEVVTLSACNTGLGKLVSGEGMLGLVRAFLYAGASSVTVSLWSVNDAATAALMKQFYRNLSQSVPPEEALRRAKIALLRQDNPQWRHPHYWAPFVLWLR